MLRKQVSKVVSLGIACTLALTMFGSLSVHAEDAPDYPVFDKKWEDQQDKKQAEAKKEKDKLVAEQEKKNEEKEAKLRKLRGERAEIGGGLSAQKIESNGSTRTMGGGQVEGKYEQKLGVVGHASLGYLDDKIVGDGRIAYRGAPTVLVNGKKKDTDGFVYEGGGTIEADANSIRATPDISMGIQKSGTRVLGTGKLGYYQNRGDAYDNVSGQYYGVGASVEHDFSDIATVGGSIEKGWICGQNAAPEFGSGFNEQGQWETKITRPATEQETCGDRFALRAGATVRPLGQKSVYLKGELVYGKEQFQLKEYDESGDPAGIRDHKDTRTTGMVSAGYTW